MSWLRRWPEQIVHQSIDRADEKIMLLLNPILKRMEKNEPFITITVRPEDTGVVKAKVNEHETDEFTARYIVLSDDTLEKNGCIIECSRLHHRFADKETIGCDCRRFECSGRQ